MFDKVVTTNEFLIGQFVLPMSNSKSSLYGPGPLCLDFATFAAGLPSLLAGIDQSGNIDTSWICRKRAGIESLFGTTTGIGGFRSGYVEPSNILVMWDQIASTITGFNHSPGLANVLFMDGHVEPMLYNPANSSADFPMTPTFAAIQGGYIASLKTRSLPLSHPDCY